MTVTVVNLVVNKSGISNGYGAEYPSVLTPLIILRTGDAFKIDGKVITGRSFPGFLKTKICS